MWIQSLKKIRRENDILYWNVMLNQVTLSFCLLIPALTHLSVSALECVYVCVCDCVVCKSPSTLSTFTVRQSWDSQTYQEHESQLVSLRSDTGTAPVTQDNAPEDCQQKPSGVFGHDHEVRSRGGWATLSSNGQSALCTSYLSLWLIVTLCCHCCLNC